MSSIETKISGMNSEVKVLDTSIKAHWNDMMSDASVRAILKLRLEVLKFIVTVGASSSVRKHAVKLREFSARISALESLPLNSKNYIKNILTPAKAIRTEFDAWKKGSVTNILSQSTIELIELEADVESSKAA